MQHCMMDAQGVLHCERPYRSDMPCQRCAMAMMYMPCSPCIRHAMSARISIANALLLTLLRHRLADSITQA